MANSFSFEDALQPQASQEFSFEDALKPAEEATFSFEDAFTPATAQPEPASQASVTEQATPPAPEPVPEPVAEQAPAAQPAPQGQEYPPYEPVQPELTAYTPSFIDRIGRALGLGPNRDRASVELTARKIAKEQGISVGEVYKQAGGSRGIFNPEGRAVLPAIVEAAAVAGESAQDIPLAFANTALRAIRGGDISGGEESFLDYAIKQTETPDRKVDKNYEDLGGLGKSLGYSFATMGSSILAGAATGIFTANPLAGGAAMMGTSGTVSYRASKDEFLDRVKTQLNEKTKQLYGRELTKEEWQDVRGDFESAAQKYGAWEAIPEAVGNMFMVKAFSAPAKGMSKPALNKLVERIASVGVENIGETVTGVGQRQAEIEAGLSKEELSVKDAFKQQFLSTMLLGGTMAGGAKSKELAVDFYKKYVEPKVDPQSALGRAIMADLENAAISERGVDAQAIAALRGAPVPTMEELAGKPEVSTEPKVEPSFTSEFEEPEQPTPPAARTEPTFTVDPETGEVLPVEPARAEPTISEPTAETPAPVEPEAVIEREATRYAKTYNLPLDLATEVVRGQYARGELEGERLDDARTRPDGGRVEPSISMPSEGAVTPGGIETPRVGGLDADLGLAEQPVVREEVQRTALTEAEVALQNAEQAVATAATPAEKKAATKERNKARQAVKKAKAEAPAVEAAAPVVETVEAPVVEEPVTPEISQEDQDRLNAAQRSAVEAQDTLNFLAEQGFTTPEQHYGVEAAQNKLAAAQEVVNEITPPAAPVETAAPSIAEAPPAKKRGRPAKPKVEGAAPTEPKKRGRKKVELTPEEIARKDAERKTAQKDLVYASRDVDKNIKALQVQVDPANFDSLEAFEVAKIAAEANRKKAIYRLNQYATAPSTRNAQASGVKAAQALASDLVTPKERADLKARVEFEKTRGPKPSAARRKTQDKPNAAYYKFTTATQALDYIIRTGTPFERALAARLKPFVTDVRLAIADTKEETPDAIQDLIGDAAGVYSSAQFGDKVHRMIVLRGENFDDPENHGVNNTIFLHEALHGATEAKIDEWQELTSLGMPVPAPLQTMINDLFGVMAAAQQHYEVIKASGAPISPNLRHKFETLDITNDPKEFVAYGMTDPDVQNFLLQAPGRARKDSPLDYLRNLFAGFVNTLRKAFNMDAKHQSALQDLMLTTEGLLREQELEPAYSINTVLDAKVSKSDKALEKVQLSIESGETPKLLGQAAEVRTFENYQNALQDNWGALAAGTKAAILVAIPTVDIIRWKGDQVPALKDIDLTTQYMAGMKQNLLEAYSKQADALGKFARKVGKKGMDTLATAMHLARLEGVSPSLFADRVDALQRDPRLLKLSQEAVGGGLNDLQRGAIEKQISERREAINNVFNAWEALGQIPDGQKMYKMVRQFYKDSGALTRALLDRHIQSLNLEGEVNDPNTPKGRLMLSVRRMYEDSEFRGVDEYFPFMRHGEHVLEVAGPNGREVYFFDTAKDRNKFITKRAAQIGADREDGGVFKAYRYNEKDTRDKFAAESRMLTDMFNAIEDATDSTTLDKEALKDELYQIYLTTLPEQSYRKQFLHADNVTGFSSDIFRNFKTSATQIAAQAAKLRYAPELNNAIERATDTLQGMPPLMQAELSPFVDEVAKRARDEVVQTEDNKIAKGINQFAFYWLLTGVASAAVQTTALPMYVMPKLNSDYGYGKAAAKFARWMNVYKSMGVTTEDVDGVMTLTAPTMGESKLVRENPILARAFGEAKARNLFGQSFSNVITDRRRTPENAYDNLPRVMLRGTANIMSGLFTGAERLTREAAYMMAFELEYAKSGDFDQAVNKATDVVQEFIGRFDSFNRARIMRNPIGMVVGQFKPYAAIVTSFLLRNAYKAAKVWNPKEALPAAHVLGSILLMGTLFHGVTGMPLYSMMTALIDAVLSGFEDDEEKKRRIAANAFTAESSDLRFRYEFLDKYFGDIKVPVINGKYYALSSIIEKGPISVLSDLNFGSRTGLDGIWFKTPKVGKDLQEDIKNWVEAFFPAAVSAGANIVKGVNSINEGKYGQGMSEILPAFFANPVKAIRTSQEGAKTKKGDVIVGKEELSDTNIVAQATGLQSTRVAQLQEQSFKLKSEELRGVNKRNALLKQLDDVFIDPDSKPADRQKLINQIVQHNKRYPVQGVAIDPDTIFRSLDNTIKNKGLTFRGMQIKENLLPYMLPLRQRLDKAVSGEK